MTEEMCRAEVFPAGAPPRPCKKRGHLRLVAHGKEFPVCAWHRQVSLQSTGMWLYLRGFARAAEWVVRAAIR